MSMRYTIDELVQKLKAAGLTVGHDCRVINPRDGYTIGIVELKQWSFKEPFLYEIEKLYCSDESYVYVGTGFGMFDQMFNTYKYTKRSVKKSDLDGFIDVCKEFIGWVNDFYPREKVLEKERKDEELREKLRLFKRLRKEQKLSDFSKWI